MSVCDHILFDVTLAYGSCLDQSFELRQPFHRVADKPRDGLRGHQGQDPPLGRAKDEKLGPGLQSHLTPSLGRDDYLTALADRRSAIALAGES